MVVHSIPRLHDTMKFIVSIIIIVTFLLVCGSSLSEEIGESFPRVITPLGTIEGYYKSSKNDRRYEAYEGVPYAQPPIGKLKFEVATSISPWTGVWMAKQFGSACLQYNQQEPDPTKMIQGSEDCLYMNIYTPIGGNRIGNRSDGIGGSITDLQPVIFYIHGGAFGFGSGNSYGPEYLLDRNVTLVTFNYRLGPLGFLSTEDATVPGNVGLKDQVIALRWVKDHIQYFGGDPSRVTIFGHSSGASSVHYHYLTNLTTGLFRGGMSLSGVSLNCGFQAKNSLGKAKKLAAIVGCPTENLQGMVDCLKARPGRQIVEAFKKFMPWRNNPTIPFGPVVEKGGGEFTFIDRPPIEIITSGGAHDVPWITGLVSEEGLFPAAYYVADEESVNDMNNNWETIAPHLLEFDYTIPKIDHPKVARLIKEHYLGSRPFGWSTVNQTVQMVGDRLFVYDGEKAARLQARANRSPVLFYYFSYRGVTSESEFMSGRSENFGVAHEDDLLYVMQWTSYPTTAQQDWDMQKKLIDLWVSFATDGMPDVGIEWPAVNRTTEDFRCLHIAGPTNISITESTKILGERDFWSSIGFNENIYNHTTT